MDQTTATILGAAIGASAALLGGWLAGVRQAKLERDKLNHAQASALSSEMRAVVQTCIAKMSAATHSMCWLTWLAKESADRISEERVKIYDDELHALLPEIIGLQARVSTYNKELGKGLGKLLDKVEDLDARIGKAALNLLKGDNSKEEKLKTIMPNLAPFTNQSRGFAIIRR